MDEYAQGIVLKTHPYAESSVIVRWLTYQQGRLDTLARGVYRPQSPLRGKLDLFYLADFTFKPSRRSQLHTLREVQLRETFPALRSSLDRLRLAAYASALICLATEPGMPIPEVFALLSGYLRFVADQPDHPLGSLAFEMKLLRALGLQPNLAEFQLTHRVRQLAEATLSIEWDRLATIRPTRSQLGSFDQVLRRFLMFHFDRLPKQRPRI